MSPERSKRFRIALHEFQEDGSLKVRVEGNCSAYVVAITEDRTGDLRILTEHDGPAAQRRKALLSLTQHIRATIGLGR